jgi:hypothetical protein
VLASNTINQSRKMAIKPQARNFEGVFMFLVASREGRKNEFEANVGQTGADLVIYSVRDERAGISLID